MLTVHAGRGRQPAHTPLEMPQTPDVVPDAAICSWVLPLPPGGQAVSQPQRTRWVEFRHLKCPLTLGALRSRRKAGCEPTSGHLTPTVYASCIHVQAVSRTGRNHLVFLTVDLTPPFQMNHLQKQIATYLLKFLRNRGRWESTSS